MDDQRKQEDHWRELADLLGLPSDVSAAAKVADVPAAPTREDSAIKAYEEPPPLTAHRPEPEPMEEEQSIPMPGFEEAPEWEADFDEDVEEDDTSLEEKTESPLVVEPEGDAEATEAESGEAAAPEEAGEDGKPRRGRRRRRRGRRRGGDKAEAEAAGADKRDERKRPPREEREPRRNRGGRRQDDERSRQPAPQRRAQAEADEGEAFEHAPASGHAPLVDDTDFSNWKVPSWQDLISSLYRPDR
jgi:hypothetical protein